MKYLVDVILFIIGCVSGWLVSYKFGEVYFYFFPDSSSSFLDTTSFVGLPLGYIFFNSFFLSAFGKGKKNLFLLVCLLPATILEMYLDLEHLYFPIIIGLLGWGLGLGVEKGLKRLQKP